MSLRKQRDDTPAQVRSFGSLRRVTANNVRGRRLVFPTPRGGPTQPAGIRSAGDALGHRFAAWEIKWSRRDFQRGIPLLKGRDLSFDEKRWSWNDHRHSHAAAGDVARQDRSANGSAGTLTIPMPD